MHNNSYYTFTPRLRPRFMPILALGAASSYDYNKTPKRLRDGNSTLPSLLQGSWRRDELQRQYCGRTGNDICSYRACERQGFTLEIKSA